MILMRKSITIKAKNITAILSYSFNKKTPIIQVNKIIYIIGIYDKSFKICYRAKYAKNPLHCSGFQSVEKDSFSKS